MSSDPNWSARFPVYQIEFSCVSTGKHIAATKRRLRWRFGFPNQDAMKSGKTGIDCRGEEHDISVVWSITSGKKQVMVDSKIIHTSMSRSSVFDYTWNMKGNHIMKISATATSVGTSDSRQYDFFVDGLSFYNMPKVYELGLKGDSTYARYPGVLSRDVGNNRRYIEGEPGSRKQEERDLELAIKASIEESRKYLSKNGSDQPAPPKQQTSEPEVDLLSFDALVVSPPQNQSQPTTSYGSNVSVPSIASSGVVPGQYNHPQPAQSNPAPMPGTMTSSQPYPSNSLPPGNPVPPLYDDPFAPKPAAAPTYDDIQNQILQSYSTDASPEKSSAQMTMIPSNNQSNAVNGLSSGTTPTSGGMKAFRSQSDSTATTGPLSSVGSGALVTTVQQNPYAGYGNFSQMNPSNGSYEQSGTYQQPYGYGTQPTSPQQYGYGAPAGASY